jgi:hypothetical protein
MANTSSTTWATTPTLGADLDSKSSTPAFANLTRLTGNDGKSHLYIKASAALASTANFTVGASGFAVAAASAAVAQSYNCNTTGGVAAGQYFWGRSNFYG